MVSIFLLNIFEAGSAKNWGSPEAALLRVVLAFENPRKVAEPRGENMNLQSQLCVELILVILVGTFENVSSFLFAHTRAKRSAKTFNDSLNSAGDPLLLTPLLEAGQTDSARNQAKVNHPEFLDVESYAGYFTVNKIFNSNLFFWYFPAKVRIFVLSFPRLNYFRKFQLLFRFLKDFYFCAFQE